MYHHIFHLLHGTYSYLVHCMSRSDLFSVVALWCCFAKVNNNNTPKATFVAVVVPSLVWDSRFCSSLLYCYLHNPVYQHSPLSWGFNLVGILNIVYQNSEIMDRYTSWGVYFNTSSSIIGQNSGNSEWVIFGLIQRIRSSQAWFIWFISLIIQYGNVFINRSGSRGYRLSTFVMISHNIEGICKRIQRSLIGLALQPSVLQINILDCGHFGGLFDKVLPVWRNNALFHVRNSTKLIVKYYVILCTHATCDIISYKCDASSVEGWVYKINPNM